MTITEEIIKILSEDSQIQSLLGATSPDDCPISTVYNYDEAEDKQINVSLELGETVPFDQSAKTHDGKITIYILVKDTINNPIETANNIAQRVLDILDIKGTTLSTSSTIYWIQKTGSGFLHYDDLHLYEYSITFRFVFTES